VTVLTTELDKIDQLRKRLGISYREAAGLLEQAGGDLLKALIEGEERQQINKAETVGDGTAAWTGEMVNRIKNILQQGNVTKIKIKKGGKTLAEIPATVGALGILGILASTELAIIAGLGSVAALFNSYTLEIERPGGKIEEHTLDMAGVAGEVDK